MKFIDTFIDKIGSYTSWLNVGMIALICIDVFLRYTFSFTKNWIIELEWHLFAILFLVGSSYALQYDKHVRVDVFYQKFSSSTKAFIDAFGTLLFLVPWCLLVIYTSYKFAANSWYINEGSNQPAGLPARYIIKSVIVLGFGLLLLQGISILFKNLVIIKKAIWKS